MRQRLLAQLIFIFYLLLNICACCFVVRGLGVVGVVIWAIIISSFIIYANSLFIIYFFQKKKKKVFSSLDYSCFILTKYLPGLWRIGLHLLLINFQIWLLDEIFCYNHGAILRGFVLFCFPLCF